MTSSEASLPTLANNQRWARLVLRRVTVSGYNSRCGTFISVYG